MRALGQQTGPEIQNLQESVVKHLKKIEEILGTDRQG